MKKDHLQSGRREQKQNTRKRILQAAHELLESGKPLTMDEAAKRAGISRATIYRYYSNTDSLSTELILHLSVPDAKTITEKFKGQNFQDALLGIQKIYLKFILENEKASKKFLGAILSSSDLKLERGQNRITAIRNFFAVNDVDLNSKEREKLIHIAVLLMGVESIIVAKDVCGLNNNQSVETLRWGLEMVLKGCRST